MVVADGDQRVEAVAHRRRRTRRHALRQQGAGLVPSRPRRTAQHGVRRRENVLVAKPASRRMPVLRVGSRRRVGRRLVQPESFDS